MLSSCKDICLACGLSAFFEVAEVLIVRVYVPQRI